MQKLGLCWLELTWEKVPYHTHLTRIYEFWNWKYLVFSVIMYMSFSCQKRSTEQDGQLIGYVVDTVLINSKERILDVGGYMQASDLDDDGRSFFLYNHHDHSVDEINLDRKEFVKTYPLDAEGPNGVGQNIFGLQCLEENLLFLKSQFISSVIDKSGRVVQKFNWLTAKDSLGEQFVEEPPISEVVVDTKNWTVMGTNIDVLNSTAFLGVLSVEEKLGKNIEVHAENSFSNYFLQFPYNYRPPWVFLGAYENYVYLSHEYSNEISLFNPGGELVKIIQYQPKLTPSRAIAPEVLISTREKVRRESRKLMEQVRFEAPVWDYVTRRYFRLSSKRIFEDGPEDEILPIKRIHIFLSVFDAEFNLVSEVELKELFSENFKYFAKDGKLWVCLNFSDELGFLVFDL